VAAQSSCDNHKHKQEPSHPRRSEHNPPADIPDPPPMPNETMERTSGTEDSVPPQITGWNWGAFWWTAIWAIAHNAWIGVLAFFLPWPVNQILLGLKGNEWAWRHRRFESVKQFEQTQATWAKWGWIAAAIYAVLATVGLIVQSSG